MEFPDIKSRVIELYKAEFLKLNNLKCGDELEVEFSYHKLHPRHNGNGVDRFTHKTKAKGVLKHDKEGLYVESYDNFQFYELTSNGLTGKNRKEWYKSTMKPSIYKIRGGLSFI